MADPQLIKERPYGDPADQLKPAGNAYELTEEMLGADLPIWGKALYLPAQMSISVVGARDHRASPVAVSFIDHPAGYLQMQVRRVDAFDSGFDPSGILVLHDNKSVDD